jgi:hypothetical protein
MNLIQMQKLNHIKSLDNNYSYSDSINETIHIDYIIS